MAMSRMKSKMTTLPIVNLPKYQRSGTDTTKKELVTAKRVYSSMISEPLEL